MTTSTTIYLVTNDSNNLMTKMYVVLTKVKKGNGLAFGDETHFFAVHGPVSDT